MLAVLLRLGLTFFKTDDLLFQFCIYIFHNCQITVISESVITFPFKAIIFCTSSGIFMAFIADSDKVNKLVLSPILVWPNWEVHLGKWDLDFKIEFLQFWMYVLPLRLCICLIGIITNKVTLPIKMEPYFTVLFLNMILGPCWPCFFLRVLEKLFLKALNLFFGTPALHVSYR